MRTLDTIPSPNDDLNMADKPNVLFLFADDLRPELGCYGCEHIISPNIDRLAGMGNHFEKCYVQIAVCNPSRASMLTGKRPDELSVWGLDTHFRTTNPDVVTLPQHFMANGYHTTAIGKIYHNDKPDPVSWSEPRLAINGFPYDPDAVYVVYRSIWDVVPQGECHRDARCAG